MASLRSRFRRLDHRTFERLLTEAALLRAEIAYDVGDEVPDVTATVRDAAPGRLRGERRQVLDRAADEIRDAFVEDRPLLSAPDRVLAVVDRLSPDQLSAAVSELSNDEFIQVLDGVFDDQAVYRALVEARHVALVRTPPSGAHAAPHDRNRVWVAEPRDRRPGRHAIGERRPAF